jgi:hypothetical protein
VAALPQGLYLFVLAFISVARRLSCRIAKVAPEPSGDRLFDESAAG